MQAVVLVGGEGTRLRPLTSTVPKPVVPLVDRPFLAHLLGWLARHGADDVILSCGFGPERVHAALGDGSAHGVRLRYVEEPDPRGTAGALRFAAELLDERFLVLNGDVLSDLDLSAQVARHAASGARATLGLVAVEDPSAYGLVRCAPDGSVRGFVEKPTPEQADTNLISAGAYVLEREVVDLIPPGRAVSIEREIWPALVGDGLFAFAHEGAYWLDIGTPATYLRATRDILTGAVRTAAVRRVADDAQVAPGARVGELAVLGPGVRVGHDSEVDRCVLLAGARVGERCTLSDCIVAPGARIGDGTRVLDGAMVGEGALVGAGNILARGVKVAPGAQVGDAAIAF